MAIKKVKGLESEYSIMPNKVVNDDLSWAALGMLTYLLSKPDDWDVMISQLINKTSNSAKHTKRDGVYSILKELIDLGYIQRTRTSGDGYSKTDYTVSSEKLKPLPDKPDQVQPDTDDPTLQSKDNKKEQKDDKSCIPQPDDKPDEEYPSSFDDECEKAFDVFWFAGMKKAGKATALLKFTRYVKKNKLDPQEFAGMLYLDVQKRLNAKQFGFENLHPTTYLNNERWNDEISAATSTASNQSAGDIHAQRQARLDEWERQMLSGGDEQCQNALGSNGGDLWQQVEPGQRGDATDRPAITLDYRDWQTD